MTTETGAGQWGTALSMACAYLDLDCKVYMVKVSYEQKPFRREVMRTYGASVTPSPSDTTEVGKKDPGGAIRVRREAWAAPSARGCGSGDFPSGLPVCAG